MRAGEAIVESRGISHASPGGLSALLMRFYMWLFGCWHTDMGRPITVGGETYRVCLDCGARRLFDTESWNTHGPYYFDTEGD